MARTLQGNLTGKAAQVHNAELLQEAFVNAMDTRERAIAERKEYPVICREVFETVFSFDEARYHAWVDGCDMIPNTAIVYGTRQSKAMLDFLKDYLKEHKAKKREQAERVRGILKNTDKYAGVGKFETLAEVQRYSGQSF